MKRLPVLILAAVAGLLLVGCLPGDDPALTVNGEEVLTVDELRDELDEMEGREDFLTANDARGEGGNLRSGFVSVVLSNHVFRAMLDEEMAAEGVEATEEDRAAAAELVGLQLAQPQTEGAGPLELDDLPEAYRESLVGLYTNFFALIANSTDDPQATRDVLTDPQAQTIPTDVQQALEAVQQRLRDLRIGADVEVHARYGRWEAELGEVVPPEGPVAPSTTTPLPVPTGG